MLFREATTTDVAAAAQDSISRAFKETVPALNLNWVLEHEGRILAVGGIKLFSPGTAWVWMNYTTYALPHMKEVYRRTKKQLDKLIVEHKLRRTMAVIKADFPEAIRMIRHLGFQQESVMARFWSDSLDGLLFVRFGEKN